jgi:hypothetical protein
MNYENPPAGGGKGTQVPDLQICKVTLKLEEVEKIVQGV